MQILNIESSGRMRPHVSEDRSRQRRPDDQKISGANFGGGKRRQDRPNRATACVAKFYGPEMPATHSVCPLDEQEN